jgi:hypothetical protein
MPRVLVWSKTRLTASRLGRAWRTRKPPTGGGCNAQRDLSECEITYLFVDGIAERLRPGGKREPVLAAWGLYDRSRNWSHSVLSPPTALAGCARCWCRQANGGPDPMDEGAGAPPRSGWRMRAAGPWSGALPRPNATVTRSSSRSHAAGALRRRVLAALGA